MTVPIPEEWSGVRLFVSTTKRIMQQIWPGPVGRPGRLVKLTLQGVGLPVADPTVWPESDVPFSPLVGANVSAAAVLMELVPYGATDVRLLVPTVRPPPALALQQAAVRVWPLVLRAVELQPLAGKWGGHGGRLSELWEVKGKVEIEHSEIEK